MRAPRYTCERCGKKGTAEQMLFSRHTGNRYCIEFNACEKRAALRNRKRRAA
jgi:hypothetical protein